MKAKYSKEDIEIYGANPNVLYIREDAMKLTYAFRVKLYEVWKEAPGMSSLREEMIRNGFRGFPYLKEYAHSVDVTFKRHGRPSYGCKGSCGTTAAENSAQTDEYLLSTGKFMKYGRGISFSKTFVEALRAQYPAVSVEDGIRAAGIDPSLVGYHRIYTLDRKLYAERLNSMAQQIDSHPYVNSVQDCRPCFKDALYSEASALYTCGLSGKDILETFEIPYELMMDYGIETFTMRIQTASEAPSAAANLMDLEQMSEAQRKQYTRIQHRRVAALNRGVEDTLSALKLSLPTVSKQQRKQTALWIRDVVQKETKGEYTLTGMLQKVGISRSSYFHMLSDETYGMAEQRRMEQDQLDMADIQKVIDYRNYPKGSRQVYMQMPRITGRHMSRKKIMRLMQKMGATCTVRKSIQSLQANRKWVKEHVKPNHLKRTFRLHRPGEVFLTDVTYLPYGDSRRAYGSASIDSVTGRVYGFTISESNDVALAEETIRELPPVIGDNPEEKPIFHSDQGSTYLSGRFQQIVEELGYRQSMSKRGNCWDNCPMESFWGHFKDEVKPQDCTSLEELTAAVQEYQTYYNEERGQWTREKKTPLEFEAYLKGMSEPEFEAWLAKERVKYEEMKKKAAEKAIARNKTLGV